MRLQILDSGHSFGTKALFALIRTASRQPTLDILKLVKYRPDFYGAPMQAVTHEAMRGPSAWSVGDRELMAAVIAKANECPFCMKGHAAVASSAYRDPAKVAAVLADLDAAPIEEPLRATLKLLQKLARDSAITAADVRAARAHGVTRAQLEDAFAVAFAFNVTVRLANAFGFDVPGPAAFDAGAKYLLARGYR